MATKDEKLMKDYMDEMLALQGHPGAKATFYRGTIRIWMSLPGSGTLEMIFPTEDHTPQFAVSQAVAVLDKLDPVR